MERVRKVNHNGKEILVVDYSDCRGDALIEIFNQARDLALTENGHYLVLNILNERTYLSPAFLKHLETELPQLNSYVSKNTVTGLSTIQHWILKGINLWYDQKIHSFNTKEEAMDFLVSD